MKEVMLEELRALYIENTNKLTNTNTKVDKDFYTVN